MLNVMRKHAGSWMIKVVLFAIVIVFVFWGVGSFRSNEASKVAKVNGEIITMADYRRVYNNLIDQYRQRFGSSLNDGMIEMLQLKRQALDQLIDRTILLQEAGKLGIVVSDAEIAQSIMEIPVFQTAGTFDNRRYQRILSQVHLTPEEFEADQKNVLLSEKLSRVIVGAAKASEEEARQWYDWEKASVDVAYVLFDPKHYTDIKPTEEDIAAYFEENKETYKTDPMVRARYVRFDPSDYRDRVSVEEDEINDYYETHISEFKTEKSVEARHILIKVDAEADEAADQAAKQKAEEIAQLAKTGQDFAELAKTHSEGPTKEQGGYLGKFEHAQMVKPFADKAFSMAAGEISDPVKTQFGWHVIKVESIEEATTQTVEQSRASIIEKLTERKANTLAYDDAEKFYSGTFEKDDLTNNAKTFGLTVREAGPFSRSGPDELDSDKGAFANAAFSLDVDGISDIQEIGGKYYLIQTTQTIDAAIPALESVKTRVVTDLTQSLQADKAEQEATAMQAELKDGKTFEESAKGRGLTVEKTGPFMRNEPIPTIGSDPAFTQAAFALTSGAPATEQPVKGNAGFYLLRLIQRNLPEAAGFENEKDAITSMLQRRKQRIVLQDWMAARKEASQIEIEETYLK